MLSKFENEIFSEINLFRENPKNIQHQIEVLGKGISRLRPKDPFLKEIDDFIHSIDRIPKMKTVELNESLCRVAKSEIKKYIQDENAEELILTGDELKGIIPNGFLAKNPAFIADSGADEAETLVPKLLLNKYDKEKKGRQILCNPNYTQVGISCYEKDGENYYILIFANEDSAEENDPELPNINLSELKQAFDLYDRDGSQKIKMKDCIDGLKMINFDKSNPVLFDIICELEGNEWCSWPKFAVHISNSISDRNSDEGLRTLFDLFIDDPNKETITFDTFKKICIEVGENMSDEEMKNILDATTQSGNDISFDDFCQFMKLIA